MTGVLVIAHGSRAKETEATLTEVLDMVREGMPDVCIEHAFMEFSERTIASAVAALVARGAAEIKIVPYFLFNGVHLQADIPRMVGECMEAYPGVTYVMGEAFGADKRLAELLAERISG